MTNVQREMPAEIGANTGEMARQDAVRRRRMLALVRLETDQVSFVAWNSIRQCCRWLVKAATVGDGGITADTVRQTTDDRPRAASLPSSRYITIYDGLRQPPPGPGPARPARPVPAHRSAAGSGSGSPPLLPIPRPSGCRSLAYGRD